MNLIVKNEELEVGKWYAAARFVSDESDDLRLDEIVRYDGERCWSTDTFIGNGKFMQEPCEEPNCDGFVLQQ